MADNSLNVAPSSGEQSPSSQSNLQASGQADLSNGLTGKVQPGIAADQLKSDQGISLSPTALSTVDLNTAATGTATTQPAVVKHHGSPILWGICVLLFIAAIVMFYVTSKSGKKHNQYK